MEASAADNCDLLVEAVIENLPMKQEMFARLDKIAPRYVVVACLNA